MKTITISSSLRFKEQVRKVISELETLGIEGLFPNLDSGLSKDNLTPEVMKRLEDEHFQAVDSSDALYVVDPGGYVGTLVSVEIGYARGKGKPVYFSERTGELGLDVLVTDFIPVTELARFVELR